MSPHAAKARGIFDRVTAPIGGHEGMPEELSEGVLKQGSVMGSAQPDVKPDGLMPELAMFGASGPPGSGGAGETEGGAGDEDLGPMGWSPVPLVRTTSNSSAGSAEGEESEVSDTPPAASSAVVNAPNLPKMYCERDLG